MSQLDALKYICNKNPKIRSPEDIDFLLNLTKSNKVFSSLSSRKGASLHRTCCRYLNYEFCGSESYLFHYGSKGSKFYIIYSGKVGVEVPVNENSLEEVLQLSDGGCFGELALESDKPRQASIKCKTDCHFIYLNKVDYQECIGNFIQERRNQAVDFLSGLPMFQDFTKGTLTKVSYILKEQSLKKNQTIYKEGDSSEEIFFIVKGETAFFKKIKPKNEKKINNRSKVYEVILANKAKGEIFGEEEVVLNKSRTCTCKVTTEECELFTAVKSDFFKSIKAEEFWKVFKSKAISQQEQLEKRVQFLCELKEAVPVYPIFSKKTEKEEEKNKVFQRSINDIGKVHEKTANFSLEKPEGKKEKTSLGLIENLKAVTANATKNDWKNLPSPADHDLLLFKRPKSSIFSKKTLTPTSSLTEASEVTKALSGKTQDIKSNLIKKSSRIGIHSKLSTQSQGKFVLDIKTSQVASERSGVKSFHFRKEKSLGSEMMFKSKCGVAVYSMNSYPVYLALWSPDPKMFYN